MACARGGSRRLSCAGWMGKLGTTEARHTTPPTNGGLARSVLVRLYKPQRENFTLGGDSGALRCDKVLLPRFGLSLRVTLPGQLALEATGFQGSLVDVHFLAQNQR
jgi:hypothetical protein